MPISTAQNRHADWNVFHLLKVEGNTKLKYVGRILRAVIKFIDEKRQVKDIAVCENYECKLKQVEKIPER